VNTSPGGVVVGLDARGLSETSAGTDQVSPVTVSGCVGVPARQDDASTTVVIGDSRSG
jgi:hypothetical protein